MIRIPAQRDGEAQTPRPNPRQTMCNCGVPGCSGSAAYPKGA